MTKIEKEGTFVLKDNRGNYVGVNSITYQKRKKLYDYAYSLSLKNGFYTYQTESSVTEALKILQEKGMEIKNVIQFHFEEINRREVLKNENNMGIKKNPFIHELYDNKGNRVL